MAWCSIKKKHRDNFTFTFTLDYLGISGGLDSCKQMNAIMTAMRFVVTSQQVGSYFLSTDVTSVAFTAVVPLSLI
jgi:hypothetical protein